MSDFTFLSEEQIFGRDKLSIFEKRGIKAAITDFAILSGGFVSCHHVDENCGFLRDRTGGYWTRSHHVWLDGKVWIVGPDGNEDKQNIGRDCVASRPALPFSNIDQIFTNGVNGKRSQDGIIEVEYGYYPQKALDLPMQKILEKSYRRGNIKKTQNSYTVDSRKYSKYIDNFSPKKYEEYEFDGKRYVRVIAIPEWWKCKLSNGEIYEKGDAVWVEVEPIKWLVDEKAKMMITEKLIFAGIKFGFGYFDIDKDYKIEKFNNTNIKRFMDNYFAKEIIQKRNLEQDDSLEVGGLQEFVTIIRKNLYDFKFNNISEEKCLYLWIFLFLCAIFICLICTTNF